MAESASSQLGQVEELVPGDVPGAEREPREVVRRLGEQQRRGVRGPPRRGEQVAAQAQQVARRAAAEHLLDGGGRPEQRLQPCVQPPWRRPRLQHHAVGELPAADHGARRRGERRAALVGVHRERPPARPLPHRRRGGEGGGVADPLVRRRPLERVEQPVVGQLGAAVEGVEGARGEVRGRCLQLVPHAALAQPGQGGQAARVEHAVEHREARGVELQDGEHQNPAFFLAERWGPGWARPGRGPRRARPSPRRRPRRGRAGDPSRPGRSGRTPRAPR